MLHAAQVRFFEENGYLNAIPVHDAVGAARVRGLFDVLEQRVGQQTAQIGLRGRHLTEPFIWEMATHPAILDCIEALMGRDILVLSTHFFCKYPSTSDKFVAWHQDVTYWGLEPPYALTAWYAVDDSDAENGCMRVIPGSHRLGILEHGKSDRPGNLLSVNQEIRWDGLDERAAVDLTLKAGEMSIHHGHLIHGSQPNRSARRRCGLTIRYVPPHVKPVQANTHSEPWPAILARGEDRCNHFGKWNLQFGP